MTVRKERHAALAACLSCFTVIAAPPSRALAAPLEHILYYANETVPQIGQSANYLALTTALAASRATFSREAIDALEYDLTNASALVDRDIAELSRLSSTLPATIFAFSNALGLRGEYLVLQSGTTTRHHLELDLNLPPLLALSPMAVPDNLSAALKTVASSVTPGTPMVVIVNSHGTFGMTLMPRINSDFTSLTRLELIDRLENARGNDLTDATFLGTSQRVFWGELSNATEMAQLSFPLVILLSCESAPRSLIDVAAIPSSVGLIAHSGFGGVSHEAVDLDAILQRSDPAKSIAANAADNIRALRNRIGLTIDTPLGMTGWALRYMTMQITRLVFFLPLLSVVLYWALRATISRIAYFKSLRAPR